MVLSRARTAKTTGVLLTVALFLAAGGAIFSRSSREDAPAQEGAPAATAAGGEAGAIERGLSYVRKNLFVVTDASDLSALIVLDYLQRKYDLPRDFAFATPHPDSVYAEKWPAWGRFLGDDRLTDDASLGSLTANPGTEALVLHALYCDRFPLPSDYDDLLRRFAEHGGYELTHASLALEILRENGCPLKTTAAHDVGELLRKRMLVLIEHRSGDRRFEALDVRYEALALIQAFLGEGDLPEEQFATLLAEQQPDGGWRPEADHPSRLHPTVLAVWALLAHRRPDAPPVPFVRARAEREGSAVEAR